MLDVSLKILQLVVYKKQIDSKLALQTLSLRSQENYNTSQYALNQSWKKIEMTYISITPAAIHVGEVLSAPKTPQIMATRKKLIGDESIFRIELTNATNNRNNSNKPAKPECCSLRLWLLIIDIDSCLKCIHCSSCIVGSLCRLGCIETHLKIFQEKNDT